MNLYIARNFQFFEFQNSKHSKYLVMPMSDYYIKNIIKEIYDIQIGENLIIRFFFADLYVLKLPESEYDEIRCRKVCMYVCVYVLSVQVNLMP